jgi:signal transduction histidine kinase
VLPAWPLDDAWRTYLEVPEQPVVMCRLDGRRFIGLLAIYKPTPTSDDLTAAKIVAHLLAERFDLYYLLESARVAAAAQERVTMARDLHDGLLQVLSGMALQMHAIAQRIPLDPGLAIDQITHLQKLVQSEQRDLRRLVDALTPTEIPGDAGFELPGRLEDLSARISRDWSVQVAVRFSPNGRELDSVIALQSYRLVHEALMNVVWHARATTVTVDVTLDAHEVGLSIEDNGCGFAAVRGDLDLDQLDAIAAGPYSIRERVRRLKGRLRLQSSADGSRLSIHLPLLAGK